MRPEITLDTPIAKYTELEHLLSILENNKFFVNRRYKFEDCKESELSLFEYGPFYEFYSRPSEEQLESNHKASIEQLQNHSLQSIIPTSCWTYRVQESYLMWKAYTNQCGVMIRSTIDKFIQAIDYTGYDLICIPIEYGGYHYSPNGTTLNCKDSFYSDERELRFYFDSDLENTKVENDYIELPVNPKELITDIVISPFVNQKEGDRIIKLLKDRYKIVARHSLIKCR